MLFFKTLQGVKHDTPPVWIMRQAGRYLPEYRAIRQHYTHFMDFCQDSPKASEVTLQPIDRFDLDAAVIFSDILTIPAAMGVDVSFTKGEGPKLTWSRQVKDLTFHGASPHLCATYEALRLTRQALPAHKSLIGFCGAPWTLACYMMDDKPSKDTANLRACLHGKPQEFQHLMGLLVDAVAEHACAQREAGADVIQLFDSWANTVPAQATEQAVIEPLLAVCAKIKAKHPSVPIILFPKAVPLQVLQSLCAQGKGLFDGLGFHHTQNMQAADAVLPNWVVFQGNLDPAILLTDPETIRRETQRLKQQLSPKRAWVANLGHGILPPTPPEHVQAFVEAIRTPTP